MQITEQDSTELCDLLGSEPDLQTNVNIWGVRLIKSGSQNVYFGMVFQLDRTVREVRGKSRL